MKRRSKGEAQAYKRTGLLAVHPQAFLELFMIPESRENEERGNVAIVDICGPLTQHDDGWCDSFEAIRGRVQSACESAAAAVVLRIDSPGGDVAGCFDTARAIRAMCAAANKPLWAHVDGKACSAGYALAAAANTICLGDTGIVGSIGVIAARADVSAMNAAQGIRIALIASGARKADGNPDQPLSEAELNATQELIDSVANAFFELVADMRGVPAASVAALQAGVFHGDAAIKARLADDVQSFDEMLAVIASGGTVMSSPYEKARAALEEAAAGDDANAAAAKRALAAMDEPKTEPDGDEPKDDDKKDDDKAAASAGSVDDAAPPDDDDKNKASSSASASAADLALKALTKVNQLEAQLKSEKLKGERDALLASRPDIPAALLPVLRAASLSAVREYIAGLPKASAAKPPAKPAATAVVQATRGAGQGGPDMNTPIAAINEMDRAMGLTTTKLACRRDGNALKFGVFEVPAAQSASDGGAK